MCTDGSTTINQSVTVEVTEATAPVQQISILSFAPTPPSIAPGASTTLNWQAQNADSCAVRRDGSLLSLPTLPVSGSFEVTPPAVVGTYAYELLCVRGAEEASATTLVAVQTGGTPVDPNVITGVWTGNFSLTMRTAPEGIVLGDSHDNAWTWNFDEGWAEFAQGMLSVGFPFHVQDIGNVDPTHDRVEFERNEDGTYTLHYGYQIYNPGVGNPRTDITTTFSITRNGNQLKIVTLDSDSDGVPGVQVPGVFPLTVSPDFVGVVAQDGSADPDPSNPGGEPGNTGLIGTFTATPGNVAPGQSFTLTWQAVRANSCTASGDWGGSKPTAGTESLSFSTARLYAFTLECTDGVETKRNTVTVQVGEGGAGGPTDPTDPSEPIDTGNGTANLSGVYLGEHMITMRGCPGTCVAGQEVVLGTGMKHSPWVWNFDAKTVLITGTTLTVGFNYEIQSVGNKGEGDLHLRGGAAGGRHAAGVRQRRSRRQRALHADGQERMDTRQ